MKIISFVTITIILLFCSFLSMNIANAAVCQNKTSIVYSNGMFNDQRDAKKSLKELKYKIKAFPQASAFVATFEFHLAYARDHSATPGGSVLGDGLEVARQHINDNSMSLFWIWHVGIIGTVTSPPVWFQQWKQEQSRLMNQQTYINDPDFQSMLNGSVGPPAVGQALFPGYRKLLNDGKRVLIVSHSQGNFYANAVYDALTTENSAWASSIGNVQVASPANRVHSGGPYTTVPEDILISNIPGAMPPTDMISTLPYPGFFFSLQTSPTMHELGRVAWEKGSYGHSFVAWYLKGTYTRDRILNHIVTTIEGPNGVGGLVYPKKCIQWPPVQTPTSWQKVLTHDWGTYEHPVNRRLERRIRDDANGWMFHASLDRTSGTVRVSLNAYDDSIRTNLPAYNISQYQPANRVWTEFKGFVPVPGGVGLLFNSFIGGRLYSPFVNLDTVNLYGIEDRSVILVSHVWNTASSAWETSINELALPKYSVPVSRAVAGPPWIVWGMSALYGGSTSQIYQFDVNKSWLLIGGHALVGDESGADVGNWAVVTIENGVLNAVHGSQSPVPMFPNFSIAPIPRGTYSLPYGVFAPLTPLVMRLGHPSLTSYYLLSSPSVSTHASSYRVTGRNITYGLGVAMFDQKVIGGDDQYVVGQGVQSAPGYYEISTFAAVQDVNVFNQLGQVHPVQNGLNIYGQRFISTVDDLQFFQWP